MANAGRILIIPKGNYDASVTYEMLDLVSYNGVSWIAKKTVVGIAPSEGEYWHNMFNISGSEFNQMKEDVGTLKTDLASLKELVVYERLEVEQTYDFIYIPPRLGYHLTDAMIITFDNGDSDIVIGKVWQNEQYVLFTKASPSKPTKKTVMMVWTKTE